MSRCLPSLYLSAWKLSWKTGATGQWESAQSHAFLLRLYIPTLSTNWRPKEQRDLVWVPNPCCISFLPQTHTNTHTPKTQRTRPCRCWHGSPHTRITNVNIYSRICVYCTHVCKHTEPPHCCPINKDLTRKNNFLATYRSHVTQFWHAETFYGEVSNNIRPVVHIIYMVRTHVV